MLKISLLLIVLFTSTHAYATASDKPSIGSIQSLIEQGNVSAALHKMRQLLKEEPKNYQAWFLLGVNQAEQGQYDDAIQSFHHVIKLQPSLAEPHNNLAVIYNETGNFRAAVDALEMSLTLKPDYLIAQENVGDLYVKLAADAYRKVLAKKQSPVLQQRYQRLLRVRADIPEASSEPVAKKAPKKNTEVATASQAIPVRPQQPIQGTEVTLEKSEAVVALASTDMRQSKQQVLKAVEAWRVAWSNKDLPAYFAAYSEEFQHGAKYVSFAKWKDYKTWAMRKREFIRVNLEHVVATLLAENVIKVQFLQHFRSDSFNNDNRKEMLFRNSADGWKIIYEAAQ